MATKYVESEGLQKVVHEVIEDFKDYLVVKESDLACMLKTEGYMKPAATIRKIPALFEGLTGYQLCLVVNNKVWETNQSNDFRYSLIFHELNHVIMNDKEEYKLRDHDVEDFALLINALGPNWENRENAKIKLRRVLDEAKAAQATTE